VPAAGSTPVRCRKEDLKTGKQGKKKHRVKEADEAAPRIGNVTAHESEEINTLGEGKGCSQPGSVKAE